MPSLLNDLIPPGGEQIGVKPPRKPFKLVVPFKLDARMKAWWRGRMEDPKKRRPTLLALRIGAGAAVLGLSIGAYFYFRPVPQPDYLTGDMGEVFNYTLLTDEFNNLPIEKRMELIGQLVQRMKSMSTGDSVLMASFAAGIAGAARKQIEENASRLAIDMWDKYAKDYTKVPEADKEKYLDQTFLNFVKMMETVGGQPMDNKTDEERLAEVRRQAARDKERMKEPGRAPRAQDMSRALKVLDSNVGGHATPEQRARGGLMMRDMVRHFRGEDPATGKPEGPK